VFKGNLECGPLARKSSRGDWANSLVTGQEMKPEGGAQAGQASRLTFTPQGSAQTPLPQMTAPTLV